jgi:hypothetical protein
VGENDQVQYQYKAALVSHELIESKKNKKNINNLKPNNMEKSQRMLNSYNYSLATRNAVAARRTEEGKLEVLNSERAIKEMFPDQESVFLRMVEVMRQKANDKCICGKPISFHWTRIKGTMKYRCNTCSGKNRIKSPLASTPLRKSHIPLNQIIEVAYEMLNRKSGLASKEIERRLPCKYETALGITRRLQIWMGLAVGFFKFEGMVECDETYVRCPSGFGRTVKRTRGLGSDRIKPVFVMAERGGKARGIVIDDANRANIKPIILKNISVTSPVFTDGSHIYKFLSAEGYQHQECNHSQKIYANGVAHTNTAEGFNSIIKGQIGFIHKGVSKEYLQEYIDAISYRYSYKYTFDAIEALFAALPPLNAKGKIVPNVNLN